MNILVTGASGFIGQNLCSFLSKKGHSVVATGRRSQADSLASSDYKWLEVAEIGEYEDWPKLLEPIDCVVHLAATAHKLNSHSQQLNDAFDRDLQMTKLLVKSSIKAGVKRFVYLSSVKVYGEYAVAGNLFTEESKVGENCDGYGLSKIACENELKLLANQSSMEYVIIRPPLVFGPHVKANFERLLKIADSHWPLPFSRVVNKRSMVSIENLQDFIHCCCENKNAANQILLVSDGDDLTLEELVSTMRFSLNRPKRLFYFPYHWLSLLARMVGKEKIFFKLFGSLQVSTDKTEKIMNWKRPLSVSQGVRKTTQAFLRNKL